MKKSQFGMNREDSFFSSGSGTNSMSSSTKIKKIQLPEFPVSSISQQSSLTNSIVSLNNERQSEGFNDERSFGSYASLQNRQSEAGHYPAKPSGRNTMSGLSGSGVLLKDSLLTDIFRNGKAEVIYEGEGDQEDESTGPDSDNPGENFRKQFAFVGEMVNMPQISDEKFMILKELRGYIEQRPVNLVEWQKAWSVTVVRHRRLCENIARVLEGRLEKGIEFVKEKKEECKENLKKCKEMLLKGEIEVKEGKLSRGDRAKDLETYIKSGVLPEIEEIIERFEKELLWNRYKYKEVISKYDKLDKKVEKTAKRFQKQCENYLNNGDSKGGLFPSEMALVLQVKRQVSITEELGNLLSKILKGTKKIEGEEYKKLSEAIQSNNNAVEVCFNQDCQESLKMNYQVDIEKFIKERFSVKSLVITNEDREYVQELFYEEVGYEDLMGFLGSVKFTTSKYVQMNSLLLYKCEGFLYKKDEKMKELPLRIGLTADEYLIIYEINLEKLCINVVKQWSFAELKIEGHARKRDVLVMDKKKEYSVEFDDVLDKAAFLNRFQKFAI